MAQSPDDISTPAEPAYYKTLSTGGFAVTAVLALGMIVVLAGGPATFSFGFLAALDYIFGAQAFTKIPFLMWLFWGIIFGAAYGFWLDAPLYGLRRFRWQIIMAPVVLLIITSAATHLLFPPQPWPAAPTAPAPPPPPPLNFSGDWDTGQWGMVHLQQDGDHVFGKYDYADGVIEGNMAGANRLSFRWRNQDGNANGVGYFDLSADKNSFTGRYANGDTITEDGGDEWSGHRTSQPPPPPSFNGTWQTEWGEMVLHQGVKTVTGTYQYGGGVITGNVDGNTLRFTWTNRATGQTGSGKLELQLYGQEFRGSWNTTDNPDLLGRPWSGIKRAVNDSNAP